MFNMIVIWICIDVEKKISDIVCLMIFNVIEVVLFGDSVFSKVVFEFVDYMNEDLLFSMMVNMFIYLFLEFWDGDWSFYLIELNIGFMKYDVFFYI